MAETPVTPPAEPQAPATPSATPSAEPTPIKLTEEASVLLPGSDKPVKYGEWFRGFQQKHTEATTQRSKLNQQLQQIAAERKAEQEELTRLREFVSRGQAQRQQPPSPLSALAGDIKKLQYLNGEDGEKLLSSIDSQFSQLQQSIQQRDRVFQLVAQRMAEQQKAIDAITNRHSESDIKGLWNKAIQEHGLPEDAEEFAEMVWLSHEGDGLRDEYPTLLKEKWDKLAAAVRAADKRRADEARRARFVPGKGGVATPSKPYDPGTKTSAEIADDLWPMIQKASGREDT